MNKLLGVMTGCLLISAVYAHESPLDAHGCHYDRNVGGYHCHKGTFAGHYFESREEMLQFLQLHMSEPRPTEEVEPESGEDLPMQFGDDN